MRHELGSGRVPLTTVSCDGEHLVDIQCVICGFGVSTSRNVHNVQPFPTNANDHIGIGRIIGQIHNMICTLVSLMSLLAWLASCILPKGPILTLQAWPSLIWLYTQVIICALTKGKSAKKDGQSRAVVQMKSPLPFSMLRLRRFRSLVGHRTLPEDEVSPAVVGTVIWIRSQGSYDVPGECS